MRNNKRNNRTVTNVVETAHKELLYNTNLTFTSHFSIFLCCFKV